MDGWIKLHRSIDEWEWRQCPETLSVWLYFLTHARHKAGIWQGVSLEAGQLVIGRKSLSKKLGISEQTIRTVINRLKSTNEITTKSTNKYTLVTVVNWAFYQHGDEKPTTQITSYSTSNQPANVQKSTTNKNDNNKYIPPISPKGDSEVVSSLVNFAVKYGNVRDNGKLADTMQKFVSWGATEGEITDAVQINGEWFNGRKSSLNKLVWAIHNRDTNALNAEELEAYNYWFTEYTEGM